MSTASKTLGCGWREKQKWRNEPRLGQYGRMSERATAHLPRDLGAILMFSIGNTEANILVGQTAPASYPARRNCQNNRHI